jgi:hypothetical protein
VFGCALDTLRRRIVTALVHITLRSNTAASGTEHAGACKFHLYRGESQPPTLPVSVPSRSCKISLNGGVHRTRRGELMNARPSQRDV